MTFFEDLGKKITETSQGVVQKTKDTSGVIRLNGMISDEEKRINSLYFQLGKRYFEMHSDSCEKPLENFILEIKEAQKKIKDYSEQVKKLKGVVCCPNCGGDVQYGATFCSLCGSRMETTSMNGCSTVKRCTACGMPIGDGILFCTHCGTKVEETPAVRTEAEHVGDYSSVAETEEVPAVRTEAEHVGDYSPVAEAEEVSAVKTEAEHVENYSPIVEAEETPLPIINRVCPNCNEEISDDFVFCMNCGTKLE